MPPNLFLLMTVTYDYRSGRAKILQRAFRIIGVIGPGRILSAAQIAQGSQVLNEMIQSWSGDNIFLWSLKKLSTTTAANTITKSLAALNPPVLDVEKAFVIDGSDELPLRQLSWREYNDINDKDMTGRPQAFAVGSETVPTLYFWPKPDDVYTINLLAPTKLADYDSSLAETDFAVQWEKAMAYGIAADLADEYGKSAGEKDRITLKAQQSFKAAKSLRNNEIKDDCFVEGAFG